MVGSEEINPINLFFIFLQIYSLFSQLYRIIYCGLFFDKEKSDDVAKNIKRPVEPTKKLPKICLNNVTLPCNQLAYLLHQRLSILLTTFIIGFFFIRLLALVLMKSI